MDKDNTDDNFAINVYAKKTKTNIKLTAQWKKQIQFEMLYSALCDNDPEANWIRLELWDNIYRRI